MHRRSGQSPESRAGDEVYLERISAFLHQEKVVSLLTGFRFSIRFTLEFHGPLLIGVIPLGLFDSGLCPNIEFHCFGVKFEPFRKLILGCEHLKQFSFRGGGA